LLAGKSAVAIFPTGGGKSLCYQLPALQFDGLTLVISPLIALMKDQIDFLQSKGVNAARLDSTIDTATARKTFSDLRAGTLKLLYVAPERLGNERFLASLGQQKISLLAVDEAHCISEWGHNFRPDYLKLARVAKDLKVERVLGLTATATPSVAQQIASAFDIDPTDIITTPFHRPNLSLRITPTTPRERDALLLERIQSRRAPTIVYVTLQKTAERVAQMLAENGLPAEPYHAGLKAEEREEIQNRFMPSRDAIIVATIAFGMGIDKRDIRNIYHYNLPKSLENYAQEVGRAGRDGNESICEMLACTDDRIVLENFTYGDTPSRDAIESLTREVLSFPNEFDVSTYDLSGRHDIRILVVETLITYLQLANLIESVGAFYSEYKYVLRESMPNLLARFDPNRQAFLKRLFAQSKTAVKWSSIDLVAASEKLNEPRDRLVKAMNFLAEEELITLEVAGVRQAFRRTKSPVKIGELIDDLETKFVDREMRDIDRLESVLRLADEGNCIANQLSEYFGERLSKPCGSCSVCRGEHRALITPTATPQFGERESAMIEELRELNSPALSSSRQITRFLCGIGSPAVARARLGKHRLFGALSEAPFEDVFEFVESM
ncbi:MAG TPA: RecQ family ATP-dependent DNA helicase, partial [Tepidisphaeraceae bacterium]|nr:RecQ family ATP-dependent DNA helicase [Tepidisphaeraceae bacterium]